MSNLKNLCTRWIEKSEKYDKENTEEVFDTFFSLFVPYNAIYFNATRYLIKGKKIGKNRTGDKISATKNMSDFIGTDELYATLISVKTDIEKVIDEVEKNIFYISTKKDNFTPDNDMDNQLLKDIKNKFTLTTKTEKRKFNISLLTLIYGVRCNMFHGKKVINPLQKGILIPMNNILKTIMNNLVQGDKLNYLEAG